MSRDNRQKPSLKDHRVSRRDFLQATAASAVAIPMFIPSTALGGGGRAAPSERIVMGSIGVGGRGTGNMHTFMGNSDVQVVAVADVEESSNRYYRGRTAGRAPAKAAVDGKYGNKDCKSFKDFRELLAIDDIDAVSVATPDHWHALVSIAAANAGKDIYCEKPLANSIGEGRAVVEAVKKNGRLLQTGSHERSRDNARFAAEVVRNGGIGELKTVRIQMPCTEPHHLQVKKVKDVPAKEAIPETLDFDFWLGHTPKVDYHSTRCHFWWRFILAHGGGEMTDRGAHVIDLAQMGMGTDLTGPVEIECKGVRGTGLYDSFMDYEFVNSYKNGLKMIGTTAGPRGLKFEGTDGWIFVHVHGCKLEASNPSLLDPKAAEGKIQLGRAPKGHHRNFLDSVKSRKNPHAHAEVGHRSASICHLNNIAMLLGRPLKWNPKKERFRGDKEANALVTPKMRAPWGIS